MSVLEWDGNTLRIKPQGFGSMQSAGAGEQQLWSLFGAMPMGPDRAEQAEQWMENFIPKTRPE